MEFPYTINDLENWKVDVIEVSWVWLTVKDTQWNLLLILEGQKKAWKRPGQWSIVMETVEEKDNNCLLNTVKRWLKEELWINVNSWEKIWPEDVELVSYAYDSNKKKVYKICLYLYDVALTNSQSEQALKFSNGEIWNVKLVSLDKIVNNKVWPLRPLTKDVLLGWNEEKFIVDWEKVDVVS